MQRWSWWYALGVAPLLFLPLRFCHSEGEPAGLALSGEASAALVETPWTLVRFGTPAAEPFEEQGLDVPLDRKGETWADARRRVEVLLRFDDVKPRLAVLDAASLPSLGRQRVRVLLNGRRVGALELLPQRHRVRLDLPAERQQVGENRLGLIFDQAAPPGGPSGHRYSARLYGLVVGTPGPALEALLEPEAPPFSFWTEDDGLVQAGPSTLQWASRWKDATLHLRGRLHRSSLGRRLQARLKVRMEDPGGVHELWQGVTNDAGETEEAWIPLPPPTTRGPQRLSLTVEPIGRDPVWAVWRDLEVLPARAARVSSPSDAPLHQALEATNVVLVVFDAAGARHFGCYGHRVPTTPEVDRLAADGVLFERAYTPAVFTLSAMASVWTSRLPDEHHRGAAHDDRLPDGLPTLAELLTARGVRTAGFVGNGMAGRGFGLGRGFAEFSYVGYRAEDFRPVVGPWLEKAAGGGRFFLYVHVRQPHSPLDAPPPFDTRFGPAAPVSPEELDRWLDAVNHREHRPTRAELARLEQLYDGNLAVADRELGWLRRQLEAAGLWDHTVMMLMADHGEALYEHGFIGHNEQLYEESVHVPLVVRLPQRAGLRGRRVATPVDLLDVAPTVADVFGLRGSAVAAFRGHSLLDIALGAPGRGDLLARTAGPRPRYALMDGTTKFVFSTRYGQEEMYDLESDPGEQNDLVTAQPMRASVYRQRLHRLLLQLPGRWTGAPAAWRLGQEQVEDLKALGYVN